MGGTTFGRHSTTGVKVSTGSLSLICSLLFAIIYKTFLFPQPNSPAHHGHARLMVGARHLVVDWVSAGSSKDPELLLELFASGEHWFHIKISSTSLLYTFKIYYCQA